MSDIRYRCHQCFGEVSLDEVAHVDLYADLCWLQCDVCASAFGRACGTDRRANPHPHGYFNCPLRRSLVQPPNGTWLKVYTPNSPLPGLE